MKRLQEIDDDIQGEDISDAGDSNLITFLLAVDRDLALEVLERFGGEQYFVPTYEYASRKARGRYVYREARKLKPTLQIAKDLGMGRRSVLNIKNRVLNKPFRELLDESQNSPSDQE